jgi:hypothetical protein
MRRWAQASQRSTCPPNAAVRQRLRIRRRQLAQLFLKYVLAEPAVTHPATGNSDRPGDNLGAGPRVRALRAARG